MIKSATITKQQNRVMSPVFESIICLLLVLREWQPHSVITKLTPKFSALTIIFLAKPCCENRTWGRAALCPIHISVFSMSSCKVSVTYRDAEMSCVSSEGLDPVSVLHQSCSRQFCGLSVTKALCSLQRYKSCGRLIKIEWMKLCLSWTFVVWSVIRLCSYGWRYLWTWAMVTGDSHKQNTGLSSVAHS